MKHTSEERNGKGKEEEKEVGQAAAVANSARQVFGSPKPQQSCFAKVSKDVLHLIAFDWLAPATGGLPTDAAHLAQTCRLFRSRLLDRLNAKRTKLTQKLVQHVVYGEKEAVKAMLDRSPGLLLHRATVVDYSGRTIKKASAYEAALGALDDDMAEMIAPYFDKLQSVDGKQERIDQFNKQFPKGIPELKPYDFSALVKIITESSDEAIQAQLEHKDCDTPICNAINHFRKDMSPREVSSGLHFNHQTLINAFEVYNEQYDGWSANKRNLFWRQVIGYVQRLLPACDAQAFAQGLYYIVANNKSLQRSFKYRCSDGEIYPLEVFGVDKRLGFDFGVSPAHTSEYGLVRWPLPPPPTIASGAVLRWLVVRRLGPLQNVMAQKRQELLAHSPVRLTDKTLVSV